MDSGFPRRFSICFDGESEYDGARIALKESGFEWDSGLDMMHSTRDYHPFCTNLSHNYLNCYTDGRKRVLKGSDAVGETLTLREFEERYMSVKDIESPPDPTLLFA